MNKRTLANVLQSSDITNRPSSSSSPSSTSNNQNNNQNNNNNKKTTTKTTRRVIYVSSALDVAGSSFIEPSTPPEGIISQESDPAPTTTTESVKNTVPTASTTLLKRTGSKTAIGSQQMDHGNSRRQSNDFHHASSASSSSSSSSQSEVFSSGDSLITTTTITTTMKTNETSTEQQQEEEEDEEEESRMRVHSPPDRKRAKRSHSNVTNSSVDAVRKPVITYCGSRRASTVITNVVTHSTNKENDNLEAIGAGEVLTDAQANSTRVREDSDREVLQIEQQSNAAQETANEYEKTEIYVQNDTNVTISVQIFPCVPVKGKVYGERYIFPGKTQFVKVRQNRKSNCFFVSVSTKSRKQMYRGISCLEFAFKHEPFRLVVCLGKALKPFSSEDTQVVPFTIAERIFNPTSETGNSSDSDESTSF